VLYVVFGLPIGLIPAVRPDSAGPAANPIPRPGGAGRCKSGCTARWGGISRLRGPEALYRRIGALWPLKKKRPPHLRCGGRAPVRGRTRAPRGLWPAAAE